MNKANCGWKVISLKLISFIVFHGGAKMKTVQAFDMVMGNLKEEGHMQICFVFPIAHNPSKLFPFFFSFVTNRRKL